MTRKRRNNAEQERTLRQQAERENESLRTQLQSLNGFHSHPLSRPSTSVWDWKCGCGRLVYRGRNECDRCRCPRSMGYTVFGSIRGIPQNTPAATAAAALQNRVPKPNLPPGRQGGPGALPPTGNAALPPTTRVQQAVGAGGHAAPPRTKTGSTASTAAITVKPPSRATPTASSISPKSWVDAVVGASSSAGSGTTQVPAQNPAAPGSSTAPADVAMSPAERFAEDEVEPAEDLATVPEEADDQRTTQQLSQRILRIEKILRDKRRQHGKAEDAVAAQIEEIAAQQTILVELQAQADDKLEQIQALQLEESVLSQRLAKLNPVQGAGAAAGERSGAPELTPVQDAMECLTKALLGLQNYQTQKPDIQVLLAHFVKGVEQLQADDLAARAPGQTTIQQSFAAQRSSDSAHAEYGPLLAAAVKGKHQSEAKPPVEAPLQLEPVLPPAGHQQPPAQGQPVTEQYDISSDATSRAAGSANEAIATPAGGRSYGRAARKHEPLCNKCWAVCCKCRTDSGKSDVDGQNADAAEAPVPAGEPETAMVLWQPPGDRMQLLAQLRDQNSRQREQVRKRAEEASSMRHSPY